LLEEGRSGLLPVLATVVMRRGKKSIMRVAQHVAALVSVRRTPSILNVYHFLDPSGPHRIITLARTGRRIEQASSDESV